MRWATSMERRNRLPWRKNVCSCATGSTLAGPRNSRRPATTALFRILDEPVVITRDADGELNAFLNVCAHRGVEVAAGNGNARDFSCPYHGWLYDLKGRLVGAPYMREVDGFD